MDNRFAIFDAQILLTTNFHQQKARHQLSTRNLVTRTFQSISKVIREQCNADKVVLCWDKAPYHRAQLLPELKANRKYYTESDLDALNEVEIVSEEKLAEELANIIATHEGDEMSLNVKLENYKATHKTQADIDEEREAIEYELYCNKIKMEAKSLMIREFGKIGVPSICIPGYEADDLAYLCAEILKEDTKPSFLVSKDSDWEWLVNKNVWFNNYKNYKIVKAENLEAIDESRPLYYSKALQDSLYGSHNNLSSASKRTFSHSELKEIMKAYYDNGSWESEDLDWGTFDEQYSAYQIQNFKDYEQTVEFIRKFLFTADNFKKVDAVTFEALKGTLQLDVTSSYYEKFMSYLDEDSFVEFKLRPASEVLSEIFGK